MSFAVTANTSTAFGITLGSDTTVIPGTANLTITTYAPTVSTTSHVTVTPSTASLTITG